MRKKLLQLLRDLEQESGFTCEYTERDEEYGSDVYVEDYVDFPNYKAIVEAFNAKHKITKQNGATASFSSNSIRAELKRMEMDGLLMIGVQTGIRNAITGVELPDTGENIPYETESVVLTTKGKSEWRYFLHKVTENPVTFALSAIAIIVSIIALFL